jgi:hypothetical protein
MKTVEWHFSAQRAGIDLDRILAETPAECPLVEVQAGEQRALFVRNCAYYRASKCDLPLPGTWTQSRCQVGPLGFEYVPGVYDGWQICYRSGPSFDDLRAHLARVEAHYSARLRVHVRAAMPASKGKDRPGAWMSYVVGDSTTSFKSIVRAFATKDAADADQEAYHPRHRDGVRWEPDGLPGGEEWTG